MSKRGTSYGARAVVTGAGSGIGAAFARELHRRGGRVVCADIDLPRARETAGAIEAAGGTALATACDVSKLEEVQALSDAARQFFGAPPTLVVNNAGVGLGGKRVEDIAIEDWRWIVGVNLWGVVHGCHVFGPQLRAAGEGGIVNVASAASFGAAPRMGAYNATKAAVLALSETMAAEMQGSGVRVSVLCPTFVKTDIIRSARLAEDARGLGQTLMDRQGMEPAAVVEETLDALDQGRLHVLPQLDARISWRLKRLFPALFTRGMGVVARYAPE